MNKHPKVINNIQKTLLCLILLNKEWLLTRLLTEMIYLLTDIGE